MKTDIILSGVGGQGILSIATIIGEAALHLGLNLKQAEVHGMSQRGGDVQSNLRLSDAPIASDLIALGTAGYDYLTGADGSFALPAVSVKRRMDYHFGCSFQKHSELSGRRKADAGIEVTASCGRVGCGKSGERKPHAQIGQCHSVRAAAPFLKILDAEVLRESVGRIFASKGEEVVQMNYRAFDIGHEYVKQLKF